MTDDKPEAPGDPRPGGEPYYIYTECPECGTDLVLYDEITDEQKRSSAALGQAYTEPEQDETWHDEWVCPDCLDGVHMDWPGGYLDGGTNG